MKKLLQRIQLGGSDNQGENTPPLIGHLEAYLGRITAGYTSDETPLDPAVQIVEFHRGTIPGVTVLSTLGLS